MVNEFPKTPQNLKPTHEEAGNNLEYTKNMQTFVHDYGNEFYGLKGLFDHGGIAMINKIIKSGDIKVKTLEEHLLKNGGTVYGVPLKDEEYENPTFKNKTTELSEIAVKFNTEGATMNVERFEELLKRVYEITDREYK